MYKKRKLEINPSKVTRNELSSEIPVINKITKNVISRDNVKNIYIKSDPSGKDYKDYMITLKQLTELLCPKFSYTWKYYGLNFAGGHYADNQYGPVITAPVAAGSGTASDVINCSIDDYQTQRAGWADTIAWEAGSQAWFEHIFLPATWNTPTTTLESVIRCQPSMTGIIDQARSQHAPSISTASNSHNVSANTTTFASKRIDYPIHYNGGFQAHTFINNENFKVHFECYECTPRDLTTWFSSITRTAGGNTRVYSRNVADLVASDYNTVRVPYTSGNISAAFNAGNYVMPTGLSLVSNQNEAGQIIANKNDLGFKIRPWCSKTLKLFRVSKPHRGSIEPGAKFVYTMKVKPFVMMSSSWRQIVRDFADDANHSGDDPLNNPYSVHLVPRFSKILIVRFWSDVGNNNSTNGGFETVTSVENPHQYNEVGHMPGRVIHTVAESHTARAVLPQYTKSHTFRDFTKLLFDETVAEQNNWQAINDETDQATQI